jgi:hypothetical protein
VTDEPDPNASTTNATDGIGSTANIHDVMAFRDSMRTEEMARTPTAERVEDGPAERRTSLGSAASGAPVPIHLHTRACRVRSVDAQDHSGFQQLLNRI